tara:strand:- start:34443 stop:34643 length:201 start_codon:yes stop_codon:yes gene_type:complete
MPSFIKGDLVYTKGNWDPGETLRGVIIDINHSDGEDGWKGLIEYTVYWQDNTTSRVQEWAIGRVNQ